MPKLKSHSITVNNAAGEKLTKTFEIHVNTYGKFLARLPATLVTDIEFMACLKNELASRTGSGPKVSLITERVHTYLQSVELRALHDPLEAAMKRYVAVETTEELVILYDTDAKVKFCLTADGRVSQNGYTAGTGYRWPGPSEVGGDSVINELELGMYSIGLWARAYVKTTSARGDKKVVRYTNPKDGANDELAIGRLNAFSTQCGIETRGDGVISRTHGYRSAFKEIPYTDEAAEFFSRMLLSMCDLALRMDKFFNDPVRLKIAIANGAQSLLAGPEQGSTL